MPVVAFRHPNRPWMVGSFTNQEDFGTTAHRRKEQQKMGQWGVAHGPKGSQRPLGKRFHPGEHRHVYASIEGWEAVNYRDMAYMTP